MIIFWLFYVYFYLRKFTSNEINAITQSLAYMSTKKHLTLLKIQKELMVNLLKLMLF